MDILNIPPFSFWHICALFWNDELLMQISAYYMFPGVLESLFQFIFVTALTNKHYSYHLWHCFFFYKIWKKEKKSNKFNRLQIKVVLLLNSKLHPSITDQTISFVLCPYTRLGSVKCDYTVERFDAIQMR